MPPLQRRRWPVLAVASLVVLNVALVAALAWRQSALDGPAVTAVPAGSSAPVGGDEPTRSSSGTPSPQPSPSPSSEISGAPSTPPPAQESDDPESETPDAARDPGRVLAVSSSSVAWRAETGRCGEAATVEVSTDSGRSWRATTPGLGAVVRLKTYGDRSVFALGADDECRATFASVESPSARWQIDRAMTADIWHRVPGDDDVVHAPGGDTSRPCDDGLVGLAGRGTYEAAAVCADGRLRTIREGENWTTLRSRTGVVAVNADDNRFTVARRMDGCAGLVVQHFAATGQGLSNSPDRCWDIPWAPADPVAVANRGDVTWLWSGEVVRLS